MTQGHELIRLNSQTVQTGTMENNGTEKRASNKNIGQNLDAVLLNDGLVRNQVVVSDEKDAAFVHGVRVGRFGEVEVDLE